ncbi:MAG: hypothetical protein AB7P08_04755 [Burkholderiales bacterium]
MPKHRSELEAAAGQLVLAVQKEWERDFDGGDMPSHEAAVSASHELLVAAKSGSIDAVLSGRSVATYLGESWVGRHSMVIPFIKRLQLLIKGKHVV